mgnify:FL=1
MENAITDTLSNITKAGEATTQAASPTLLQNLWFWIALAEFLLLLAFILLQFRKRKHIETEAERIKRKVMQEGEIDFGNTLKSAFHAQELYDELKVRCHPDRFPADAEKNRIATEIFQKIVESRNNYKSLLELKARAEQELEIKFKK